MKKGRILLVVILLIFVIVGTVRMYLKQPVQAEGYEEAHGNEVEDSIDEDLKEVDIIEEDSDIEEEDIIVVIEETQETEINEGNNNSNTATPPVVDNNTEVKRNIVTIEDPQDILVLVNKERTLPSDYVPSDLVIPNISFSFSEDLPKKYMRKIAADALEDLFKEATNNNIELFAVSGYRAYSTQKSIFEANVKRQGEREANKTSAFPGQSEHQTGLAMDVSSRSVGLGLKPEFGDVKEGIWLKENAHRFGFIIRYPKGKEHLTGYSYEPWHLRYVGKEVAEIISASDITLEEYFKFEYTNKDIY
ncbi:M15 family metallopeptidase [Alkaliphilus peptidifermentans]|uniref:D-alanyl-D-alanine carboxypeptidase n=1 Tax=Alkaliphilus peptidifermentans DSM 18978 TaxID=1120976 RepID=A0A1G5JS51_9FIRM|nr:M15 family metallopeptidase [Alkaliphilus peptidifermentans]SCY91167.1 D-alanyl-D-alanine carboxypeptidase [Alkaliphilus peptidifermentans DSM 18978]